MADFLKKNLNIPKLPMFAKGGFLAGEARFEVEQGETIIPMNANVVLEGIAENIEVVVRCKDCKHYKTIECSCSCTCVSESWYCADGERKAE